MLNLSVLLSVILTEFLLQLINMKAEINGHVWNFVSQMLEFLPVIQLFNELNKRLDITLQFKFEIFNEFNCLTAYVCIQIS